MNFQLPALRWSLLPAKIRGMFNLNDPRWGRGSQDNNDQDSRQNSRKPTDGPPDLDQLWRDFNQRLNKLFGGQGGGRDGGEGNCISFYHYDDIVKLEKFMKDKPVAEREIGELYTKYLKGINHIELMPSNTVYSENIYWVYTIMLNDGVPVNAEWIMQKLQLKGIGTRPFFYPMHLQPVFQSMGLFKNSKLPISEDLFNYGFYIPCGIGIKKKELIYVVKKIKKIFK